MMFSRCVVVKTCAKYEEIKKRDLFLFFFLGFGTDEENLPKRDANRRHY